MNRIRTKRLFYFCIISIMVLFGSGLILYALKKNINVFLTPSEILQTQPNSTYRIRLGGLVKDHSVQFDKQNLSVRFLVTDLKETIPVHYIGVLPDLFHENKGMVAEGTFQNGVFEATQVLAKHDEKYMPIKIKNATEGNTS